MSRFQKTETWLATLGACTLVASLLIALVVAGAVGGGFLGPAAIWLALTGVAAVGAAAVLPGVASGAAAAAYPDVAGAETGPAGAAAPPGRTGACFANVAGLDEVMSELQELVNYVRDRNRYVAMDARLPRGVLLYGPPGTGKTLLARALAAEAGAAFLYASGSSFVEKYVGVGAQRIRDLFRKARAQAPAIVFIDEIDSVARPRGGGEAVEWDSTLNQLLTELDGFDTTDNVLLVAATNRRDMLDEALLRPGRLDRQIYIGLPDRAARLAILRLHTERKPLAANVDLDRIARRTPGLAGAHLAAIANEAALLAVRAARTEVQSDDFDQAIDRVLAGTAGRAQILSPAERRLVAFHEAGHAVVGWALDQGTIERISLLRQSQALGYVLQVPAERALYTRGHLLDRVVTLLGGRAAEQLVTGDFTTGAADDLRKATGIIERMVTEYGMGAAHPHQVLRSESLIFSRRVADEVSALIQEAWERARDILRQHRGALEDLACALMERESLEHAEVEALLAPAAAPAAD